MTKTYASQSHAVDYGFDTRVEPKTLKLVFTAFLLGAQHKGDSVENFHPAWLRGGRLTRIAQPHFYIS